MSIQFTKIMAGEMLIQMNNCFHQEAAALGLVIRRISPADFMDDLKLMKDCQWVKILSVEFTSSYPPASEWRGVARTLAMMVQEKLIGNCALFFDSVPIVRQEGNAVYVQLLLPEY